MLVVETIAKIRRKHLGEGKPRTALLVESAIDALSACTVPELRHADLILSTAGIATDLPAWIRPFQFETVF